MKKNKKKLDNREIAPVFVLPELSSFLTIDGDREYRVDRENGRKFLISTGLIKELDKLGLKPKIVIVADATVSAMHKEGKPIRLNDELLGYKKVFQPDIVKDKLSVWNIDHHFPVIDMQRYISSTNLAIKLVNSGLLNTNKDVLIVVNHADTDSVLSSLVLSGFFDLEQKVAGRKWQDVLGEAVIAADHTGNPNLIADLVQSIQDIEVGEGQPKKYDRAVLNLKRLFSFLQKIKKYPVTEKEIQKVLLSENVFSKSITMKIKKRLDSRGYLKKEFGLKKFKQYKKSGIWYWSSDRDIEGELVVGAMKQYAPKAKIVLIDFPFHEKRAMRVRSLSEKINLQELGVGLLDFNYGGRWNAGSNRRAGGTDWKISEIACRLSILIEKQKESIMHAQNMVVDFRTKMTKYWRNCSKIEMALRLMIDLHLDHEDRIERDFDKLYLTHPIEVANILIEDFGVRDKEMIIAALLHDVLEDESEKLAKINKVSTEENIGMEDRAISQLKCIFGSKVARLIENLTNPRVIGKKDRQAVYQNYLKKILHDEDSMKIKLADFCHNALNLDRLKDERKKIRLKVKYFLVAKMWLDVIQKEPMRFKFLELKKKEILMLKLKKMTQ